MAMTEYVKKRAAQAIQQNSENPAQMPMTNGVPNSALLSVFEGKTKATSQMMGRKENLAPSVAAKMSRAFGMNFMDMQVYRSDTMKGTGMKGLTQGNKVIISSDIDLNTTRGQAVLGHEFSHVHAQSQGVGTGHSGLYENASLEAQADREGLLAAEGRPIYGDPMSMNPGMSYGLGMAGVEGLTPIGGGMSASAGAPMQAKKGDDRNKQLGEAMAAAAEQTSSSSKDLAAHGTTGGGKLSNRFKEFHAAEGGSTEKLDFTGGVPDDMAIMPDGTLATWDKLPKYKLDNEHEDPWDEDDFDDMENGTVEELIAKYLKK